jgi:uncharacterized membrane protein
VTLNSESNELQRLQQLVRELTTRVYRLERAVGIESVSVATEQKALSSSPPPPPIPTPFPHLTHSTAIPPTQARPASRTSEASESNLESRIGSHWLNRIGIAAVLIGVSYFLKFAFDSNWIGPAGRVSVGLLAGIAVVVWSERFRNRGYAIFSYSLKAVGIGVLYLSLWAAFHVYSLIPSGVAFLAMLIVTAATATLAITQDAQILAVFALTGGFATPVLLSTGQNKELQLFSYTVLLNLATLALLAIKPWRRLLLLSYLGTLLLYVGWYSTFYDRTQLRLTLGFASLFFAIFAVAPLVARQPENEAPVAGGTPALRGTSFSDKMTFSLVFINAGVYFLQVYAMYEDVNRNAVAWFALALAAVYIFLSREMHVRYPDPSAAKTLQLLHLALAIGFITIAIPIRLDAHWITIGWLVEAVVLFWVGDRSHSDFLSAFAIGAVVLGVARLLFFDNFYSTMLIFNARMATHAVAIAAVAIMAWQGFKRHDEAGEKVAAIAVVALNLLALIALSREVADYFARQMADVRPLLGQWNPPQWSRFHRVEIVRDFTYSALWMAYGAMLMVVGFWRRSAFVRWLGLFLIAATIVKVFAYDTSQLDRVYRVLSFIVLGILLLAISFVYQRDWLKLSGRKARGESAAV